MEHERRFAVLIDADNVSEKYIKFILDELSNDGVATYKRIYGDWTSTRLASWKGSLLDNSVTPMQQYSYTSGKNATDSAMIIDAMDILYTASVDGFCLVSSDSDFTRLAVRLREAGMYVIGMGEKKTPKPFIAACDKFTYLEVLVDEPVAGAVTTNGSKQKKTSNKTDLSEINKVIKQIVTDNSDDDGWAQLGMVGTILTKRSPDFDVRNYGYSKLTLLIKALGDYEMDDVRNADNSAKVVLVRIKG
ncbi:MAG: NYN domain-containing protein [Ruminococcaceae bacterium]|nr:NYN domain-containing protein [Oscillospiraceae bacterium]